MRTSWRVLVLTCGAAPLAPAAAHHSPAMLYDLTREITVEGVVTEYQLGNPHMRVYFEVEVDGKTEQWLAEGGSRTQLLRAGWTGDELSPGDKIVVRGHPSRDGSKVVHMQYLTLPDGTERFAEDIDLNQFNDRRRRPQ
ncbi:MAG TPA: DUF6152 family protein [Gammaproteobacteria bacterium]